MDQNITMGRSRHTFNHFRNGFALAEVVVALFIITMAIALIAGLGQQVMQLSKSAKQTGAVVDLRSKSIALVKDPDLWLAKLRGMPNFAKYNACFPDPNSNSTAINCPTHDPSIFTSNPGLNDVAAGYVGISAPLVDSMGSKIAGTDADPLYMTADGAKCEGLPASCALRSVSYFLRSTPETNIRPTTVRFVVRIDKNPLHTNSSTAAMKPQFIAMDVNTQSTPIKCPNGSIHLGTLTDGKPYCVPTASSCSPKITIGVDSKGATLCEDLPSCGPDSRHIVLNPSSGKLECTPDPSPCPVGSPYLGNFAGTNEPICSNSLGSCTNGVMMGVEEKNGSLVNKCVALPTPNCKEQNKTITFDGNKFVCQSASVATNCPDGEVVVGIYSDGSAKCEPENRSLASTKLDCPDNQYVSGLMPDGSVKCKALDSGSIKLNPVSERWTGFFSNNESHVVNPGEYICGIQFRRNCDFYSSEDGCINVRFCKL